MKPQSKKGGFCMDANILKTKKENGQFFTITNPFFVSAFYNWFNLIPKEKRQCILEPFAGSNNIVKLVNELGIDNHSFKDFKCYDIDLSYENQYPECEIEYRDTIQNFPTGYSVVITNPPYLAKNSATRNKLAFPETEHDDLYKVCLELMLNNVEYIAAIIPESFITSGIFLNRLHSVVSLTCKMFDDTDCPVCLAMFVPESIKKEQQIAENDFLIYRMDKRLGLYNTLMEKAQEILQFTKSGNWQFNDKEGEIGIICIDNTIYPSIRFVAGNTISQDKIKVSSRSLTRVSGLPDAIDINAFLEKCNSILNDYRHITSDIGLTSFKGLRDDNCYRRRLDFKTARIILNAALEKVQNNEKTAI